jgi:Fe-S cluster assembly protein SufD
MNETMNSISHYKKLFEKQEQQLATWEPLWLSDHRRNAMDHFLETGFPKNYQEDWKYTNLSTLEKRSFIPALSSQQNLDELIKRYAIPETILLVFNNGHFVTTIIDHAVPDEVLIISLTDAIKNHPEKVKSLLTLSDSSHNHHNSLNALNTALMQDGAFIFIPPNTTLKQPIQILHLHTQTHETKDNTTNPFIVNIRNLITVSKSSEVTLIENFASSDNSVYFNNAVTELMVEMNTRVEHVKIQQESINSYHIGTLQIHQSFESQVISHSFSLGTTLYRQDIHSELAAEKAQCHLNGFYFGDNKQHIDYHTTINHAKPYTISKECFKGLLNDKSRAVFNGKIIVQKDAQHIDSDQANHTLLLSKEAEIDTKPQLEIYADQVKCTHGATVGQLNEEALFFFRSRGLSVDIAQSLLMQGFANELLDKINNPSIRSHIHNLFLTKLPAGSTIRELI